jgi:hypothetical protein
MTTQYSTKQRDADDDGGTVNLLLFYSSRIANYRQAQNKDHIKMQK